MAGASALVIAVIGLVASLFVPLAYCKYGCPTGAVFKLLRYAGDGDCLGRKDLVAAIIVAAAAAARWSYGA